MLIVYIFCRKINFTINEILSISEDDPPQQPTDILLFPPDHLGNVSNEDNAKKDDGMKNVNQLDKELLSQKDELVLHYNEDKLDKNDVYELLQMNEKMELLQIYNQDHPAPILSVQTLEKEKRDAQHKKMELGLVWGDHIPLTKMLCKKSLLNENLQSLLL